MCTKPTTIYSQTNLHQMLHILSKLKSKKNLALRKHLAFLTHLLEYLCSGKFSPLPFILRFEVTDI